MKKIVLGCAAVLLSLGLLAGCNNEEGDKVVSIKVDNTATVVVGESLALPYTVEPEKAKVEVLNDHEEYVTASTDAGLLCLDGLAAGNATITLVGTYKKYEEANVKISVSVVPEGEVEQGPGAQEGPSLPEPASWVVGGTYLFGFPNGEATEMQYIDGSTVGSYSYEGSLTDSVVTAVPVTVGEVETEEEEPEPAPSSVRPYADEGGTEDPDGSEPNDPDNPEPDEPELTPYTLTFEFREVEYWITIITSGDYVNLSYSTEEAYIYWNEDYSCWGNSEGTHFLCNNTRYGCLYCSAIEDYIESSPIAALYDIPEGTVHEDKPLTLPIPGEVSWTLDQEYFLGITVSETDYFFTGEVYNSNYGGVSSDNEDVVPVTISRVEDEDVLYSLSFTDPDDSSKTMYLNLTESGNYHNLKWTEEVFGWTWDTRCEAFVAYDSNGTVYYIGDQGTYKEITLLAYEYISGDTEPSYEQHIATLYDLPEGPTTITISGDSTINVGSKGLLEVSYGEEDVWRGVTWSSGTETVATVDPDTGVVTGVGEGTATITATALHGTATQTFTVTVNAVTAEEAAQEKTVTINADSIMTKYSQYTLGSGNSPEQSCQLDGHSTVADDVLITWDAGGGTGVRLWNVASGTNQIRVYNGASITFDVGAHVLTEITMSGTSTTNFKSMTISEGGTIDEESTTDSGSTRGLTATISDGTSPITITAPSGQGNTYITSITVTYTLTATNAS